MNRLAVNGIAVSVILATALTLFTAGVSPADQPEQSRSQGVTRGKLAPPLECSLTLEGEPQAGQQLTLKLEVQNRFQTGTVKVQFDIPEPLRVENQGCMLQRGDLAKGEKTFFTLPVFIADNKRYLLKAHVALETPGGSRVSSGATLTLGNESSDTSMSAVLAVERPNGDTLRVHRDITSGTGQGQCPEPVEGKNR